MDNVVIDPNLGDTIVCPGCAEAVTFVWFEFIDNAGSFGWQSDNGFICLPDTTLHADHIVMLYG